MRFRALMFALLFIAIVLPLPTHGGDSDCVGVLQTRLAVGVIVRISSRHEIAVHLYANPGERFRRVATLRSGMTLRVTSGPVCADARRWWKVRSDDWLTGWISDQAGSQIEPAMGLLDARQHNSTVDNPTFR